MKQISYRVLVSQQMKPQDQINALAEARTVLTGVDAARKGPNPPWGCRCLDALGGRVFVLTYKGVDIVLFYHRAITSVHLLPGDPVPVGVIEEPEAAWMRFELLSPNVKQVSAVSTKQRIGLTRDIQELTLKAQQLDSANTNLEASLRAKDVEIDRLSNDLRELKRQNRVQQRGVSQ